MKSVQPPNFRDNYTLTLTPDELSLLKTALIEHLAHGGRDQDILDALYSKLQLTLSSDGACLRPAQPLEAVVEQGGLIRDSVRHGGTVVPDHICGQCYTDKSDSHSCNRDDCLEKSISGVQDCTRSARLSGLICYQCDKRVNYLFDDSRCKDCTRLTREEIEGNVVQGGSISKYAHYSDDELQNEIEFLSYENGRVARGHASQVSESLKEALEEKALRPLLKREYDDTEGRTCFVCSCDPCVCLPEAVERGGSISDEIYQSIFESSKSLFNVIDNLLDSIPVGDFKERCRELRTAVSLVFHFHMDRFGDDCRHSAYIPEAPGQGGISSEPDSPKYSLALTRHQKDFIRTALIAYNPANDFEHDSLDEIQNLFLAAKPLNSELVNLTLDEQELILVSIESFKKLDPSLYPQGVYQYLSDGFKHLYHKILSIVPDSPGALTSEEVRGNVDYMQCHSPD